MYAPNIPELFGDVPFSLEMPRAWPYLSGKVAHDGQGGHVQRHTGARLQLLLVNLGLAGDHIPHGGDHTWWCILTDDTFSTWSIAFVSYKGMLLQGTPFDLPIFLFHGVCLLKLHDEGFHERSILGIPFLRFFFLNPYFSAPLLLRFCVLNPLFERIVLVRNVYFRIPLVRISF